ncbi:MAG: hypothetical protein ACRD2W_25510 [Acidimicrobiales bacterium]
MISSDDASWIPLGLTDVVSVADPIPFDIMQSIRASFNRRSVDAELAELIYDSVLEEPVGVRSGPTDRHLSFQGPHVSVEVSVAPERRRVVGQLVPALPGDVEVRHGAGSYVLDIDEYGRFFADEVPHGPVSFRCWGNDGGRSVVTVTDWIVF